VNWGDAPVKAAFLALTILVAQTGFARAAEPSPPADSATVQLIETLGLIEGEKPLRETAGWKRPKKVVILSMLPMPPDVIESYRAVAPGVKVFEAQGSAAALPLIRDADALIGACDPGVIAAGKNLKWIQSFAAGVEDCANIPAIRERGIVLTNTQRVQGPVMAEHTIGLMLALSRQFEMWIQNEKAGVWRGANYRPDAMQVIAGKTLLVSGLGGIGTEIARRAHALGMNVIATRASGRDKPEFVSYVGGPDELPALLKQADIVVNATPLTDQTRGLFNARMFAAMKPSAYFLNVGRGGSVVTDDLVEALNKGVIAGAGLDVTDPEPLPPEHPLWRAPNTIITPHVSSHARLGLGPTFLVGRENLRRYASGEKMLSVVDTSRGY
jgi:phosphoglycerate dehydrogenase-like enzyme